MKKRLYFYFVSMIVLLMGCGVSADRQDVADADPVAETGDAEAFLKEFFSFDKDQRCSGMQSFELSDLEMYYEAFEPLVTEKTMDELYQNRLPLKYDILAAQNERKVTVTDVWISPYRDDTYEYRVSVESRKEEDKISEEVSGQISVGEGGKVSHIYIKDEQSLQNILEGETP